MTRLVLTTLTKLYRVYPMITKERCVVCSEAHSFRWMWKFHRLRRGFLDPGTKHACFGCTSKDSGEARKRLDNFYRYQRS